MEPIWLKHYPRGGDHPFPARPSPVRCAAEPKVFLPLAGGHNDGFIFRRPEWVDLLADFLRRYIKQD